MPAGPFLIGSDKSRDHYADDDELPQHTIELSAFYIGKYPVTNAEHAAFTRPTGRKAPPSGKADHPAQPVHWQDAGRVYGMVKLSDWQAVSATVRGGVGEAARGTDGRLWPWGNKWDPKRANTRKDRYDNWYDNTTSVGTHSPQGDSPYGCADMAGNVWESTSSLVRPYPYVAADGRENLGIDEPRVLRGGSCFDDPEQVRCAFRFPSGPNGHDLWGGFRVVVPISESRTDVELPCAMVVR